MTTSIEVLSEFELCKNSKMTIAYRQSTYGHIPSMVYDKEIFIYIGVMNVWTKIVAVNVDDLTLIFANQSRFMHKLSYYENISQLSNAIVKWLTTSICGYRDLLDKMIHDSDFELLDESKWVVALKEVDDLVKTHRIMDL